MFGCEFGERNCYVIRRVQIDRMFARKTEGIGVFIRDLILARRLVIMFVVKREALSRNRRGKCRPVRRRRENGAMIDTPYGGEAITLVLELVHEHLIADPL